jgi:hypothetical protein
MIVDFALEEIIFVWVFIVAFFGFRMKTHNIGELLLILSQSQTSFSIGKCKRIGAPPSFFIISAQQMHTHNNHQFILPLAPRIANHVLC